MKKIIISVVCVLLLAPVFIKYSVVDPAKEEGNTYEVFYGQLPKVIRGTGTSISLYGNLLTLNTSGRVEKLHAQAGDIVEAGQLLMTLSSVQLESELHHANNLLSDKQLIINELESELSLTELESKLEIKNLNSNVELEKFKYTKYSQLYEKNQLSSIDMKERELNLERLQLSIDMKSELYEAKLENMRRQIELRKSQLLQAKAHLQVLKKTQKSLNVRAKHRAILSAVNVEEGEFVNQGKTLASMYEAASIGAIVDIPQESTHLLNHGDLASVFLNGSKFQAKVTNIDANVKNNHIAINLTFVETAANLKVGQYLSAEFIIEDKKSRYYIHHGGSFYEGQALDATLYKDKEVTQAQIVIGDVNNETAEIISPNMHNIKKIKL